MVDLHKTGLLWCFVAVPDGYIEPQQHWGLYFRECKSLDWWRYGDCSPDWYSPFRAPENGPK